MNFRLPMLWVVLMLSIYVKGTAQTSDSVKVSVPSGVAVITSNTLGTTPTTLQLAATVYPITLGQSVTWSVISGNTATGSINTAGLLTVNAQTSGYIWVKATSVVDPSKSDSIKVLAYCKPSHTNPLNWFNIDTVRVAGTTLYSGTNSVGNTGAYVIFPATGNTTTTFVKGNTYTLHTQVTSPAGPFAPDTTMYSYSVSAWVDYNRNGAFESTEWIQVEDSALNRFAQNSINVPVTAASGYALMRIRVRLHGSSNGIGDMCLGYTGSGQTEDYIISIGDQPTCSGDPGPNPGDLGCVSFVYNGQSVIYPTVRGADGNVWLQKNLGATQVATSLNDVDAYGDVFQWGRWADGHQVRTAATSATAPSPNNPAGLGTGTSVFYTTSPAWWNVQSMTDTWSASSPAGVTATGGCDPCKQLGNGWHLPSVADWQAIVSAESITSPAVAFSSHLKMAVSGVRNSSGTYDFVGSRGYYWSNEPSSTGGKYFYYSSAIINPTAGGPRAQGAAIRCIRSGWVDSVVVSVQGNAVPQITTNAGTLQMAGKVYPASVSQNVTWSIVPGTGTATITAGGLVTAATNGTVWAKAVSVVDTNQKDSVEILISNQIVLIDSVTVATQGNVAAAITTNAGTLQLVADVHPATAVQSVSWNIIPVTGNASINATGNVTAQANGTVWAKATSVQDATKADSILITISGQIVPVDSVTVNTQGNVAAVISVKGGTLQLVGAVHPATASQSLQWSLVPVSGVATIDANGNVTAAADGTVWAKAISVQDQAKADSILITISGQSLSVQTLQAGGKVKLYPNPASASVYIETANVNEYSILQVRRIDGTVVHTATVTTNRIVLDVSQYIPGLYIVTMQAGTTEHVLLNIAR